MKASAPTTSMTATLARLIFPASLPATKKGRLVERSSASLGRSSHAEIESQTSSLASVPATLKREPVLLGAASCASKKVEFRTGTAN